MSKSLLFDDDELKDTTLVSTVADDKSASLFDIVNDISFDKKGILALSHREPLLSKGKFPFTMIANALLKYPNTVEVLDFVNHRDNMPVFMYEALMAYVPAMKRRGKWSKIEDNPNVEIIKEYFNWSLQDAQAYVSFVTDDEIATMKQELLSRGETR